MRSFLTPTPATRKWLLRLTAALVVVIGGPQLLPVVLPVLTGGYDAVMAL